MNMEKIIEEINEIEENLFKDTRDKELTKLLLDIYSQGYTDGIESTKN